MARENIFKTKHGLVSAYALSCGYVQTFNANGLSVELSQDGGTHNFNVKVFNNLTCSRLDWISFDNLSEARNQFAFFKRNIKKGGR